MPEYTSTVPLPPRADAANRAARTFVQGLGVDVLIAVLPVAYDAVSGWDGAFTRDYWTLVGVSLLKTATIAGISYVMRLVKTPPGNPPA